MYGLRFRKGSNALICLDAEFEVRSGEYGLKIYKYAWWPHGSTLYEKRDTEWVKISIGSEADELLLSVLPTEYGVKTWTWLNFILALTFWSEGVQKRETNATYE